MASTASIEAFWSERASSFDEAADHGLIDREVRAAWTRRLDAWLPAAARRVLDVGCGTGSLAWLLAARMHEVTGIDLSVAMLGEAARKGMSAELPPSTGIRPALAVADASDPPFRPHSFDAILCRHLVWTLPDPERALARWTRLLTPVGRLVAIEGWWNPSADADPSLPWDGGVSARTLAAVLDSLYQEVTVVDLTPESRLWGRDVTDERYAVIATGPLEVPAAY